jgi:hypothetical protein
MDIDEVIDALKRRGHAVGPSAKSSDGKMLLNIDWKLITFEQAAELLTKELDKK